VIAEALDLVSNLIFWLDEATTLLEQKKALFGVPPLHKSEYLEIFVHCWTSKHVSLSSDVKR
jgi:hypothetical protein